VIASELRVTDLHTAVHLLGVLKVRRLQKAFFTLRDARQLADGLDWRHLWIHALATASLAEELDRELGTKCGPQLYLAGLLHDVGKIALSTVAAETYRAVLVDAWNEKGRLEDLEKACAYGNRPPGGGLDLRPPEQAAREPWSRRWPSTTTRPKAVSHPLEVVAGVGRQLPEQGVRARVQRLPTLGEADGDFSELPAWEIFWQASGRRPDFEALEMNMRQFSGALRAELRSLREIT
jgi:hypothetical protein